VNCGENADLWFQSFNNADKPPIEELHQFLEFQLPRQWAPVFGEIPLGPQHRKRRRLPSLQFTLMGPRLHVNTDQVRSSRSEAVWPRIIKAQVTNEIVL